MQEDLFGETPGEDEGGRREALHEGAGFIERARLSISLDKLLFGLLAGLIFFVLVFSLGVQYGKRSALESLLKSERSAGSQTPGTLARVRGEPRAPTVLGALLTPAEVPAKIETGAGVPVEEPVPRVDAWGSAMDTGAVAEPLERAGYTIQLITYLALERAAREVERLRQDGFDSFIIPSGQFFQVCADTFESREAAKGRLAQVKQDFPVYRDAYVRPIQRSA